MDNREIVILNARSIAKRERNIGHPEVAAIIEDLASQLSGVVGERELLEACLLHGILPAALRSKIHRALNNTGGQSDE